MNDRRAPEQYPRVHPYGPRVEFADPLPVGNVGPEYGIQQAHVWRAGDTKPRDVIDVVKADWLWRFSVFGRVLVDVLYGTRKARAIVALQAPVVLTVPGQLLVTVTPRDDDGTSCVVSLTPVTASGISQARSFIDDSGGAVSFAEGACRFFALSASALTIAGVAVAVPALAAVPLTAGSVLVTGSGFQEFEA
jgi:hypothetical protein